jgi:hypothetical protein
MLFEPLRGKLVILSILTISTSSLFMSQCIFVCPTVPCRCECQYITASVTKCTKSQYHFSCCCWLHIHSSNYTFAPVYQVQLCWPAIKLLATRQWVLQPCLNTQYNNILSSRPQFTESSSAGSGHLHYTVQLKCYQVGSAQPPSHFS